MFIQLAHHGIRIQQLSGYFTCYSRGPGNYQFNHNVTERHIIFVKDHTAITQADAEATNFMTERGADHAPTADTKAAKFGVPSPVTCLPV
jgi:hypothetical protein